MAGEPGVPEPSALRHSRNRLKQMDNEFHYDVFLSHSSKDKTVIRPIAERLQSDGLKVWFDEWEIKPGDNIPVKIDEGLEHSRVLVLFMSSNAFGSDWTQLESGIFRFRDPLNKNRRFIPVRLDNAVIKGSLAQFRYIDLSSSNGEIFYAELLKACNLTPTLTVPDMGTSDEQAKPAPVFTSNHDLQMRYCQMLWIRIFLSGDFLDAIHEGNSSYHVF